MLTPVFDGSSIHPSKSIHRANRTAIAALMVLAFTGVIHAPQCLSEQWGQFRGPTGQGISNEKGLPMRWSATENVAWKTKIDASGWSSPIAWDDRIYLTGTTDDGTTCHVMAIDVATGKVLWDVAPLTQKAERKETMNSYASPTPVTDGEKIYAVFADGSALAVDRAGQTAWINRDHTPFYSRHGLGSSPILCDDRLVMPFDGSNRVDEIGQWPNNSDEEKIGWQTAWDKALVVAWNTGDGSQAWQMARGMSRISHMTPQRLEVDGKPQIVSAAGDVVQGIDPANGTLLWTLTNLGEGVTPSPAYGDGMIFTSSGFGDTQLRGFRLGGGSGDLTEKNLLWEQKKGVTTRPSLLYAAPYLYSLTENGILVRIEGKTGEIVEQLRIGGNFSASPVLAEDHLFCLSESGETAVVSLESKLSIVARNTLDEPCQASMAVHRGRLFIRTDAHLYCIAAP
jgi:outer membrane protein assembly factor BamB